MRVLRRIMAFAICLPGVLLPWRMRVLYCEALGWLVQFVYMNYIYILKLLLRELDRAKESPEAGR